MLNQFIRIQIRNIGVVATGCPMDGLIGMVGTYQQRDYSQYRFESGLGFKADRTPAGLSDRPDWTKRLHRLRHWHAQPTGLQLRQG